MKNKTQEIPNSVILEAVISLQGQFTTMQEELRTKYATKADLADMKEELLAEIRPIGRAVDKDALSIIDHERRIHRLETQMA